ncbi:hypothetical protein [Holospora undulata]|uniref:Uncharacterized protein n=1 Tax=Holospora undulata HU1 TaxID=1321371 RepID=A0A061JIY3_9PROT|nr:hypothetical protein [Holospora undulata]ETZ05364.1 hypothetical protein K737_300194 [Holospora undulata HU1]
MNVRSALKVVLFQEFSCTKVKNMKKILRNPASKCAQKRQAQSPRFVRKRPFNEPNCPAFWCQRHRCFEVGGHIGGLCAKIDPFPEDKVIVMEVDKFLHYLKKEAKNLDF